MVSPLKSARVGDKNDHCDWHLEYIFTGVYALFNSEIAFHCWLFCVVTDCICCRLLLCPCGVVTKIVLMADGVAIEVCPCW